MVLAFEFMYRVVAKITILSTRAASVIQGRVPQVRSLIAEAYLRHLFTLRLCIGDQRLGPNKGCWSMSPESGRAFGHRSWHEAGSAGKKASVPVQETVGVLTSGTHFDFLGVSRVRMWDWKRYISSSAVRKASILISELHMPM
jgi:hypothetical protein